ncbi:protein insensitive [Amia ocellicauda]|uniref:protein insensitive n=1 Tax=Amia ocellicauda TaxID=2972642 RepID=UPI003463AA3E
MSPCLINLDYCCDMQMDDIFLELPGGLKVQKNLYNRISTTDFKKYTSELLVLVFNRETLATHSLQGRKSSNSKEDFQKPPLPSEELANIIEHIKIKFGVDSSLVRAAIRTKLNNEDKMLKKRLNNLLTISQACSIQLSYNCKADL